MAKCKLPYFFVLVDSEIYFWFLFFPQRKPQIGKNGEVDVRGEIETGEIPGDEYDPGRRVIRHTMKMMQGPYPAFDKYYSLEDTIDLYNEIWYESSSSDN